MDPTIQVNIREYILMNFMIKLLLQIVLHKKKMLEYRIGCLGPQRGRLPWDTQQMTNDGRSFALPITVKNLFRKVPAVHNSCFQLQVYL